MIEGGGGESWKKEGGLNPFLFFSAGYERGGSSSSFSRGGVKRPCFLTSKEGADQSTTPGGEGEGCHFREGIQF